MPCSSALSFIRFLEMPICTKDTARLITTVARMISSDGHTSAGAKLKICAT